jgi:tRNA(Ile)-lysidine synthase TilS/MesJ
MTQISTSELFSRVKDAQASNIKILEILVKHGTPENSEQVQEIGAEIADMLSVMIYEIEEKDQKIGVDLEFIGDKPKFALYLMPSQNSSCQTGSCG